MRLGCHGRERRDETGCWWSELDVGDHGPRAGGGLDFWLSVLEKSRRRFVMVDVMRYDTLVICFLGMAAKMQADHLYTFNSVRHTASGDDAISVAAHNNSGIRCRIYVP